MAYHEVGSDTQSTHGESTRCPMGNVINSAQTDIQICEFYCSHDETFQEVLLRLMEGTTPVNITAVNLYPRNH